jgi:hypothetical protein
MRSTLGMLVVAGAACLMSGTAFAASDNSSSDRPNEIVMSNIAGPAEVQGAPNGDDTIVCNYQRQTGTLFVDRVCRTLRAWKTMQADSQEFLQFDHLGAHQAGEHN